MAQEFLMDIADRIKLLRESLGMSLSQLGGIAGVTKQAVHGWERGTSKPDWQALKNLETRKNISMDWIMLGSGDMFVSKERRELIAICQLLDSQSATGLLQFAKYLQTTTAQKEPS